MTDRSLVERIRDNPQPGDCLVSARGTVLRVLNVRHGKRDTLVVFLVVPEVEGKPSCEKSLLLDQWRNAPGWDQVVDAY